MIEVISAPENVAAFRVAGTLTAKDCDKVIPVIEEKLSEHQEIGILADLAGLEDMTGDALRRDLQSGLSKLGEFHPLPACRGGVRKTVGQGGYGDDGRAFPADRGAGVPGGRKDPGVGVGSRRPIASI
ncbi:STAS/SEC14 domain-containing protein [Mesorhizobium sp. BHbdii]